MTNASKNNLSFGTVWVPFANSLGFGAKTESPTYFPLFDKRGAGEALSKNNRSSGCFCLQALWNILASKESVSNRSEPRCLSQIIRKKDFSDRSV
jgi:hypothetical protein